MAIEEERQIQNLVASAIEEQMHKLEIKLRNFTDMEQHLEIEWAKVQTNKDFSYSYKLENARNQFLLEKEKFSKQQANVGTNANQSLQQAP